MELWPAIDLRGGKCVRLVQGDYAKETVFDNDPIAVASRFVERGASRIHLVDLDGAKAGSDLQSDVVSQIVRSVAVGCQLGGGVRSFETAVKYFECGVSRLIVGSLAIEKTSEFERLARAFPGRIVLGLDARDGLVATRGWIETSSLLAIDVARRHEDLPLAAIVYTDIARDGTLLGPNIQALRIMIESVKFPVVASGGISSLDDIHLVRSTGAAGCIVGRALYDGRFSLEDAIKVCGE